MMVDQSVKDSFTFSLMGHLQFSGAVQFSISIEGTKSDGTIGKEHVRGNLK